MGPIFTTPTNTNAARYPQCVIYNPPLNIVPDSAFIAYYAPCANPTQWNSQIYGRAQLGGTMSCVQRVDSFNAGFMAWVPEELSLTQQGNSWISDMSADSNSGYFRDTIYLSKGTWNTVTKDFDYTRNRMYLPLNPLPASIFTNRAYADHRLAFAPNGTTGYIAVLGHNTSYSSVDSSFYPILYKTTNGGITWSGATNVSLAAVGMLLGISAPTFTTGTELDMVVDVNGNPHIVTTVGRSDGSWGMDSTYGNWGVVDIWSPNGGVTWNLTLLHKPHRLSVLYPVPSTIEEFTRPQASINWAGDKVFFTWYVTDTTLHPVSNNSMPDAFIKAMDVVSGLWTDSINISNGVTNAAGEMTFGVTSPYVLNVTPTSYEIPIAFNRATVPNDMFQPGQHKYLGNFTLNNTEFNKVGNTVTVGISSEDDQQQFSLSQNFPNPFNGITNFQMDLSKSSYISIVVSNLLGETVLSETNKPYTAGTHTLTVDASKFSPGVYFYTVKAAEFKITKKMIVK